MNEERAVQQLDERQGAASPMLALAVGLAIAFGLFLAWLLWTAFLR